MTQNEPMAYSNLHVPCCTVSTIWREEPGLAVLTGRVRGPGSYKNTLEALKPLPCSDIHTIRTHYT